MSPSDHSRTDMTRKAYLAKAGLKLSDSGGRQVVDKWYGMEGADAEFAASDRPEFNPLDPAVCVEAEATNFCATSEDAGGWHWVGTQADGELSTDTAETPRGHQGDVIYVKQTAESSG